MPGTLKCFTYVVSFHLHSRPMKQMLFTSFTEESMLRNTLMTCVIRYSIKKHVWSLSLVPGIEHP